MKRNKSAGVWVEKYKDIPLRHSKATVDGFLSALGATPTFNKGDDEARKSLFKASKPEVERAHMLYFAGHGTFDGPLFNDGDVASFSEVSFGKGDLAFIVFDCCRVLRDLKRWQQSNAFCGLHYALGFARDVRQSEKRGKRFAELLLKGTPIPEAWKIAATESEGLGVPWSFLRAVNQTAMGPSLTDEVWSNQNPPSNDPVRPFNFLARKEQADSDPGLPGKAVLRKRIKLFRTLTAEQEDFIQPLIVRFGLQGAPRIDEGDTFVLKGPEFKLEVYKASDSFWLSRVRPQAKDAFNQPLAKVLNRSQFRSRIGGLDLGFLGKNLALHLTSRTEETLMPQQKAPQVLTRHLDYASFLDNLPILGPGSRTRITAATDEIDDILQFRRESKEDREFDILTPRQAESILRKCGDFSGVEPTINEWRLGYFSREPWEDQDYLVPVYAFAGEVSTQQLKNFRFVRYVQAIPEGVRIQEFPEGSVLREMPTVFQ